MNDYNSKIVKEERINNSNGSYITKEIYEDNTSCIRYWDKNKNNIKCEFYSDNNFENLEMTSENKFKKNGSYVSKNKYEEPTSDNYQSIIGYYNFKNELRRIVEYTDKNFSKPLKAETYFYYYDGINSMDILSEYFKEHYSKIEKYDIHGNIIVAKKWNGIGLLAYFIFYPVTLCAILFYILLTILLTYFCGYIALILMSLAYFYLGIWLKTRGDEY